MRLVRLCVAIGLACIECLAQEICRVPKRGPSADAIEAFEKIQEAVGMDKGTILLYASSDALIKASSGAVSVERPAGDGTELWIIYDPDLIKGDGRYFALAHETAHLLNHDPRSPENWSKEKELRADGFAARYLTRPPLNWTSEKLSQALNALPIPQDARGLYPSLDERRAQVTQSYQSEYARLHPEPGNGTDPRAKAVSALGDLSGRWEVSGPAPRGIISFARRGSGYIGTLVTEGRDLTIKGTKASPGQMVLTLDRQAGQLTSDRPQEWSYEYDITLIYYDTGCRSGVPLNGLTAKVIYDGQAKYISFNAGFNLVQHRSSDRSCTLKRLGDDGSGILLVQPLR